jgi:hypothetical protein
MLLLGNLGKAFATRYGASGLVHWHIGDETPSFLGSFSRQQWREQRSSLHRRRVRPCDP